MTQFTSQTPSPRKKLRSCAQSVPTAVAYVRKLRGSCQAHLLRADDGVAYVVKFIENPQGRRVLANELLGSRLLSLLGVATPKSTPMHITREFLDVHPEVAIELKDRRMAVSPGLAFASPLPVEPETQGIYDFLPDKYLLNVVNLPDFAGALLLDQWAGNSDARQCIFFRASRTSAADTSRQWTAQMIDNGLLFSGGDWTLSSSPISGPYRQHCVYREIRSWNAFEPCLERMFAIDEACLQRLADSVPDPWIAQDRLKLRDLMMRLCARKPLVPGLIADVRRQCPECFPNWLGKVGTPQPDSLAHLAGSAGLPYGPGALPLRPFAVA